MNKALLLITVACLLVARCAAECELAFTLNPQLSNFSFSGAVVEPMTATLVAKEPGALVVMDGSLLAALPEPTKCPNTVEALVQQLGGATFETTPELGPLQLFPTAIAGQAGTLANVSWTDVAFNFSTAPLATPARSSSSAGSSSSPQFESDADVGITEGYVLVTSLLSPDPETVSLVGVTAGNSTQVVASADGGLARVELRNLYLIFRSVYYSTLMGKPLKGVMDYVLNGTIVMEAAVGCGSDCGPHGRCWPDANGTEVACECECGWAGASCEIPSGFCPRWGSLVQGGSTCPALLAPSPSPSEQQTSAGVNQAPCIVKECNSRQSFNAATGRCECLPGWSGPECASCKTGEACAAYYGVDDATCSAEYNYTTQSRFKAYSCDLKGTGLEDAVAKSAFYFSCNTTEPGATSTLLDGQYCQVGFALKNHPGNPISCKGYQCSFRANSTRVDCQTTHCECEQECPDVQGILDSAEGKPVWVDCDPGSRECTIEIQDFFVTFIAPCTPAECLVEGYTMAEGGYTVTTDKDYNPVIAAIPLMALLAVAALLSVYLFTHWSYWAAASAKQAGSLGPAPVLPHAEDPVLELRFEQLSCFVALPKPGLLGSLGAASNGSAHGSSSNNDSSSLTKRASLGKPASSSSNNGKVGENGGHNGSAGSGTGAADGQEAVPGMREVLRGVSGVARCGELVGVLGPSGSGKTTLLALLTGSTEDIGRGAHVSGEVLVDGSRMHGAERRKVAFVPQDDTLLSTMTVLECITYSALLRLPSYLSPSQVQSQVWRVIDELGLRHVAGSRVGGGNGGGSRGISGGERRRVTIAMELVTNPAILVLDEPTSGLDSYTALQLMNTLKQVASHGRIVLLSFHQPSPGMFGLLDRAYLLAQGSCLFSGPPSSAEAHFAAHGLPCPADGAIAEHMLQVVSDSAQLSQLLCSVRSSKKLDPHASSVTHDATARVALLGGAAGPAGAAGKVSEGGSAGAAGLPGAEEEQGSGSGRSGRASSFDKELEGGLMTAEEEAAAAAGGAGQLQCGRCDGSVASASVITAAGGARRPRSLRRELAVLFWRTLVDILRNPSLLLLHWAMAIGMGLLMGAIFFGVGLDVSGAQNRAGGLFFSLAFFAFTSLTITDLLTAERKLVVREVRGGYYRPATYLLAKAVLDGLLLRMVPAFLYSAPFYPMMGLQTNSSTVALFLMLLATFSLAVGALSLAVTVGCSTPGKAGLVMNLVLLVSLLVGGFFVNVQSIQDWIAWLHNISLFYYAYSGLMINEVATLSMTFAVEGYEVTNVKGLVFLNIIGIDASNLTVDIIILACLYLACLLLAFALLYLRMPRPVHLQRQRAPVALGGRQRFLAFWRSLFAK